MREYSEMRWRDSNHTQGADYLSKYKKRRHSATVFNDKLTSHHNNKSSENAYVQVCHIPHDVCVVRFNLTVSLRAYVCISFEKFQQPDNVSCRGSAMT